LQFNLYGFPLQLVGIESRELSKQPGVRFHPIVDTPASNGGRKSVAVQIQTSAQFVVLHTGKELALLLCELELKLSANGGATRAIGAGVEGGTGKSRDGLVQCTINGAEFGSEGPGSRVMIPYVNMPHLLAASLQMFWTGRRALDKEYLAIAWNGTAGCQLLGRHIMWHKYSGQRRVSHVEGPCCQGSTNGSAAIDYETCRHLSSDTGAPLPRNGILRSRTKKIFLWAPRHLETLETCVLALCNVHGSLMNGHLFGRWGRILRLEGLQVFLSQTQSLQGCQLPLCQLSHAIRGTSTRYDENRRRGWHRHRNNSRDGCRLNKDDGSCTALVAALVPALVTVLITTLEASLVPSLKPALVSTLKPSLVPSLEPAGTSLR